MELIPTDVLVELIIVFICLLLSAFFSSSETAVTTLGPLKTKHLIETTKKNSKHLMLWLKSPNHILTSILIFNNLVNILASVLVTTITIKYFGNYAVGIATGTITFLILIFGEIIPKSFAKINAEILALPTLKINYYIFKVFYPLVIIFSKFAAFIINSLGGNPHDIRQTLTEAELEFMVNEGEAAGVLGKLKKDMISGVFELDEKRVREIMTPRTNITAIDKKEKIKKAIKLVNETGHSRIPVFDSHIDNIIGILFSKDLLRAAAENTKNSSPNISEVMRKTFYIPESKSIISAFKDLQKTRNHMAIVIDEHGGTAGIVTMEDILEEIVGEIQDEFDSEEVKIRKIENNNYEVSGSVNISEFFESFDLDESLIEDFEQEVDTISGLVTYLIGDIPKVGQSVSLGPFFFKVTKTSRHRIEYVQVSFNDEKQEDPGARKAAT